MTSSTEQPTISVLIGKKLRNVREQQKLSLQDVEAKSDGQWKASVLGAYERGDRSITIARLNELAEFYHAPTYWFLPEGSHEGSS